jgi:hypothetical protein
MGLACRKGGHMFHAIRPQMDEIASELPEGTQFSGVQSPSGMAITTARPIGSFSNDDEKRDWLRKTLNQYVNVLRPQLKQLVK